MQQLHWRNMFLNIISDTGFFMLWAKNQYFFRFEMYVCYYIFVVPIDVV